VINRKNFSHLSVKQQDGKNFVRNPRNSVVKRLVRGRISKKVNLWKKLALTVYFFKSESQAKIFEEINKFWGYKGVTQRVKLARREAEKTLQTKPKTRILKTVQRLSKREKKKIRKYFFFMSRSTKYMSIIRNFF